MFIQNQILEIKMFSIIQLENINKKKIIELALPHPDGKIAVNSYTIIGFIVFISGFMLLETMRTLIDVAILEDSIKRVLEATNKVIIKNIGENLENTRQITVDSGTIVANLLQKELSKATEEAIADVVEKINSTNP